MPRLEKQRQKARASAERRDFDIGGHTSDRVLVKLARIIGVQVIIRSPL
jgi:hypothetical protein